MPGKYKPLTQFFTLIDKAAIRISFSAIEQILKDSLPDSASVHPEWWANHEGNTQSAGWMGAGWKKTYHSFQDKWVEFIKD